MSSRVIGLLAVARVLRAPRMSFWGVRNGELKYQRNVSAGWSHGVGHVSLSRVAVWTSDFIYLSESWVPRPFKGEEWHLTGPCEN